MVRYFLPIFVIVLILMLFLQLNKPKDSIVVLMKKDIFAPDKIEIKKGTKVIFKNEDQEARWPASNLHPTHGIYPEFDSKKPVETGEVWSFIFEKSGSFKFHDHLIPSIRGVVIVSP